MNKNMITAFGVVLLTLTGCASFQKDNCEAGGLAVYGNWCGPRHPKTGACPPVNWVDEACKKHDECYSEKGYFSCECDEELKKTLREGNLVHEPVERKYTFLCLGEKSPFPQRIDVMEMYFKHTKCVNRE